MLQYMHNRHHETNAWKYLLLALFLFVQSFSAAAHQASHIEQDVQEETCILCQSSDNNPIDTTKNQTFESIDFARSALVEQPQGTVNQRIALRFAARAPPSLL